MIPEDMIGKCLGMLSDQSEPGRTAHSLLTVAAPTGAVNLFGQPDPAALAINWATILAVGTSGQDAQAEDFIAKAIMAAGVQSLRDGTTIYFAGLVVEGWGIPDRPADEAAAKHAQALLAELRLDEHPDAVETARLYAACRDGRRWTGERILTGPHAGRTTGPDIHVGRPGAAERGEHAALIRTLAGVGMFRVRPGGTRK
jgi:hypothetical protein